MADLEDGGLLALQEMNLNWTTITGLDYAAVGNVASSVKSRLTISLSLPKCCNFTPRNVHERFQTLLTPVLTIFTDFLSAVVTSEIAQILSLYGGGFLALKWQS